MYYLKNMITNILIIVTDKVIDATINVANDRQFLFCSLS